MELLERLQDVLSRVLESQHSSFYRNFYAGTFTDPGFLKSYAEWESIPFLTKADISHVPYESRIFIDRREVEMIRLTSGTTKTGVLAMPRVKMPFTPWEAPLLPVSSCMGFLVPHRIYDNHIPPGCRFIGGDPANLRMSARLARLAEVEGLAGLPSTLIAFAPILAKEYDMRHIRHLCLNGDVCTKLQRAALERLFPRVQAMVSSYGSAEIQGLCAISAPNREGYPNALLGHPELHYELIDEKGDVLREPFSQGELVISTLYARAAFPLIRYRTGDSALLLPNDSGQKICFSLQGRTEGERIRFDAGTIIAKEIERAIEYITHGDIIDFEASVGEENDGGRLQLTLTISLMPMREIYMLPPGFAQALERELHVSENKTYADAIERGSCTPIRCALTQDGHTVGKRRRLIDTREY